MDPLTTPSANQQKDSSSMAPPSTRRRRLTRVTDLRTRTPLTATRTVTRVGTHEPLSVRPFRNLDTSLDTPLRKGLSESAAATLESIPATTAPAVQMQQCINVQAAVIERLERENAELRAFQLEAKHRYERALARDEERLETKKKLLAVEERALNLEMRMNAELSEAGEREARLRAELDIASRDVRNVRQQRDKLLAAHSLSESARQANEEANAQMSTLLRDNATLSAAKRTADAELGSLRRTLESERAKWSNEREHYETSTGALRKELAQMTAMRDELRKHYAKCTEEIVSLRNERKAAQKAVTATGAAAENQVKITSLRAELARLRSQLGERDARIRTLEERAEAADECVPLRERVLALESQVQRSTERLEAMARLEARLSSTEEERDRVLRYLTGGDKSEMSENDIAALPLELRRARNEVAEERGRLAAMQAELERVRAEANIVNNERDKARLEADDVRGELSDAQTRLEAAERRCVMLVNESNGLKRILSSYDKEAAATAAAAATATADSAAATEQPAVTLLRERVTELEKIVEERDAMIARLDAAAAAASVDHDQQRSKKRKLSEMTASGGGDEQCEHCKESETERTMLNKELERLLREVALLERRIGRGEFDSSTTKVMHLRTNPITMLRSASSTSSEAAATRSSVGSAGGSADGGTMIDEAAVQKRIQRLKEVFKAKIHEFREVVYYLFGYRIDVVNSEYRLHSMYAEQVDDCLVFRCKTDKEGGIELNMLATPFGDTLHTQVQQYLVGAQSIPAFLSVITLELFENTTLME